MRALWAVNLNRKFCACAISRRKFWTANLKSSVHPKVGWLLGKEVRCFAGWLAAEIQAVLCKLPIVLCKLPIVKWDFYTFTGFCRIPATEAKSDYINCSIAQTTLVLCYVHLSTIPYLEMI